MNKYYIEDIKVGISDGGVACGPIEGNVIVQIKYKLNNLYKYISNVEVCGMLNCYMTNTDIFADLIKEDLNNAQFIDLLNKTYVDKFNGIDLSDYESAYKSMENSKYTSDINLIKILIVLTRCEMKDTDSLIEKFKNKYVDEVLIPSSDIEEDMNLRI